MSGAQHDEACDFAITFDSRDNVFWIRSPAVTNAVHGVLLQGVSRVRSVNDRVLADALGSMPILGAVVESQDAELDSLLVVLSSSTAIGLTLQNGARAPRHDRPRGRDQWQRSLLLCLDCPASASARQAFAWPTATQVRNNVARGFTYDSVKVSGSGTESFTTWSPSNVTIACTDTVCANTVDLPTTYDALIARGLPWSTRSHVRSRPARQRCSSRRSMP